MRALTLTGLAGIAVVASALLHMLALPLAGPSPLSGAMLGVGLVYLVLGYGLLVQRRWLAWPVWLILLAGVCVALAGALGATPLPRGLMAAIAWADLAALALLFVRLWRG